MPTLNSHTITHSLSILMVFVNRKRFAKPHQPTLKPKLGKDLDVEEHVGHRKAGRLVAELAEVFCFFFLKKDERRKLQS